MKELLITKDQVSYFKDLIIKELKDETLEKELVESIYEKINIDGIIDRIESQIRQPNDGKDAEITDELIAKVTIDSIEKIKNLIKDGKDGRQGERGPQGLPGRDGRDGESIRGLTGPQGPRGLQGIRGLQGPAGKDGKDGKNGKDGKQGPAGKDGKSFSLDEIPQTDLSEYAKQKDLDSKLKKLIKDLQIKKVQLPYGSGDGYLVGKPLIDEINKAISKGYELNFINFANDYTGSIPNDAGVTTWNKNELSLDVYTGIGPTLQIGQEIYILIYNDTGTEISNSTVLRPFAAQLVGDINIPTVQRAKSDLFSTAEGTIMVATMDIPNGEVGLATRFGKVRNADTSMYNLGDGLYISETTAGELTNIRPAFPNYDISVGGVLKVDATDGEIFVSVTRSIFNTVNNFWNGVFRESFNFLITSNGSIITGSLSPANGHPDMTMMFSDGFSMLDTSPAATIQLTPGTDSNPQLNYIYIPKTTKVLTLSTSDWPTTEHIKVAAALLRSASTTQTDGALKNHNWNDHVQSTVTNQGHLAHIGERIRQLDAKWDSGVLASVSGTPANVYVSTTAGVVYQMHRQTFSARSMPTDDIHILNHPVNPYLTITNLNTQIVDANNATLVNRSFSFVIWGVQNKSGEMSHLMCNLPTGSYSRLLPQDAVNDALNYSVYTIPKNFQGVGFLIARLTFQLDALGTSWILYNNQDLRGYVPNSTAGGGAGASGITEWTGLTDTPSAYTGFAGLVPRVNSGENALDFSSVRRESGLKSGTLASPPSGLIVNELWEDTTDSAVHPILRISKTTT